MARTARSTGPACLDVPEDVDLIVAILLDRADADAQAAQANGTPRSAAAAVRKVRSLATQLEPYGTPEPGDVEDVPPAPFRPAPFGSLDDEPGEQAS